VLSVVQVVQVLHLLLLEHQLLVLVVVAGEVTKVVVLVVLAVVEQALTMELPMAQRGLQIQVAVVVQDQMMEQQRLVVLVLLLFAMQILTLLQPHIQDHPQLLHLEVLEFMSGLHQVL
jgi:hypothetical protein